MSVTFTHLRVPLKEAMENLDDLEDRIRDAAEERDLVWDDVEQEGEEFLAFLFVNAEASQVASLARAVLDDDATVTVTGEREVTVSR